MPPRCICNIGSTFWRSWRTQLSNCLKFYCKSLVALFVQSIHLERLLPFTFLQCYSRLEAGISCQRILAISVYTKTHFIKFTLSRYIYNQILIQRRFSLFWHNNIFNATFIYRVSSSFQLVLEKYLHSFLFIRIRIKIRHTN